MKKFLLFAAAATLALSFTACGGSDDNGDTPDIPTPTPDPTPSTRTPEEAKIYIEETGSKALSLFNTADHKTAINFCQDVVDEYGDLDFPDNFYELEPESKPLVSPAYICNELGKGLATANASRVNNAFTYIVEFSKFTGIYEPGRYEWERTGNSNDIIFRFPVGSQTGEVRISAAGGNNPDYEYTEEGDYYYGEPDETYIIRAPKQLNISIKKGNESLANAQINADINVNGHYAVVSTNVTVANINFVFSTNANDNLVTETQTMSVGGQKLVSTSASVAGNKLCDQDAWEYLFDNPSKSRYNSMFTKATFSVDVLGRIQLYGVATEAGKLYEVLDREYSSWEYSSQSQAQADCQAACDVLNQYIVSYMCFDGTNKSEGTITFAPSFEDYWYNSWEYLPEARVKFADGTTYTIDSYFEEFDFDDLTDQFESLVRSYERLWK